MRMGRLRTEGLTAYKRTEGGATSYVLQVGKKEYECEDGDQILEVLEQHFDGRDCPMTNDELVQCILDQ